MNPLEVLVIFHCRNGETEHRALAAALGAVQGRATIRLRRLTDAAVPTGDNDNEALKRMRQEYVAPTDADVLRADALIVAAPPDFTPSAGEWQPFIQLLSRLGSEGKLRRKLAMVTGADPGVTASLVAALQHSGLVVMDAGTPDATQQGRELVLHAQALGDAISSDNSL